MHESSPPHRPAEAKGRPAWKRLPLFSALRRLKGGISSHIQGIRLQRRVERGYRLVPERALEDCYIHAIRRLQEEADGRPLGDYLEFGVCHGASLACMHRAAQALGLDDLRMIGFDSFAGLPQEADEPEEGPWRSGDYRSSRRFAERFLSTAGVDWSRTTLIEGWFQDTLTDELRARHALRKASVIMIDCDIYSSARCALDFCAPLIRDEAVILFDDWHADGLAARNLGERRAFEEFMAAHSDLAAERLPSYAPNAEVFLVSRRRNGHNLFESRCLWDLSLVVGLMAV